ncbi:MAG: alpha/beta fold hydrolase [Acidimicrobiales bacterium]
MVIDESDTESGTVVPTRGGAQRASRVGTRRTELFVTEKGEGPRVLLLHGQPGVGKDFAKVAALLEADHRVISPDRPGYGSSSAPAVSMEENANLMAELLEERSAVPATVVGHSYGGGVAILLAARRPDLVAGLVLVGSLGRGDSVNAFDRLLAAPVVGEALSAACLFTFGRVLPLLRRAASTAPRDLVVRLRASLPDSQFVDQDLRRGHEVLRSFVFEQRALISEIAEVEASLKLVDAPTIVVTGEWDVVVPPSVARSIAAAVRGAELVTVERAGHFVPRDAPSVVARTVRSVEDRARQIGAE